MQLSVEFSHGQNFDKIFVKFIAIFHNVFQAYLFDFLVSVGLRVLTCCIKPCWHY